MKRKQVKTKDGIPGFCGVTKLADPRRIKQHPQNTRRHPEEQLKLLATIVNGNGWREPATVSKRSGLATRGHARIQAAILAGWKEIPIDVQPYESAEAELADLLADTRIKEFSSLSDEKLRTIVAKLKEASADLTLTALAPAMVDSILRDYQRSIALTMLAPNAGSDSNETIRQVILVFDEMGHNAMAVAISAIEKKRAFASLSELFLILLREHANSHTGEEAS